MRELTREEILAMEPGYEMDLLIATKIMGVRLPTVEEMKTEAYEQWKIQGDCRHFLMGFEAVIEHGEFKYRYKTKLYSTMISAAWEVVEKLRSNHVFIDLYPTADSYNAIIDISGIHINAQSAPEAIAKAALLAVLEATP